MRETKRRKMGYWEPFNVWWREYVAEHDKRPKVHEMKKWYEANAERVWGGTGPTWDETKKHSKGMRRIEDISDYFRQYRRGRRKKAAGGSIDSDTTDTDADEVMEGTSTPHSQAKHSRKAPAGGGGRGRGRPRQEAAAAAVATDLGTPGPDQPTGSGSSAQFPAQAHSQQPPDMQLAQPTVQLPPDEKENLLQQQQQALLQRQQQEQQLQQQEKQQFIQLCPNGGPPLFPPTPAAQAVQQQRASSSSFLNPLSQLRTASTSELPMPLGSVLAPTVPAPPLQPAAAGSALRQSSLAMVPPPPQQQQQQSLRYSQDPHQRLAQHLQQQHHLGQQQQQQQHILTKLEEPEQPEHPHLPHPSYATAAGRQYGQQQLGHPHPEGEEFAEAGSPPEEHPLPHHYPTIFGVPVAMSGLAFFGTWRTRSAAMPPHPHPHGHHPGHPPPLHQPYPGHAAYMQRSLTMPRVWSQPQPSATAAVPPPPQMQRRMPGWGMGAMSRMLSMPRSLHGPAPPPQHQQQMPGLMPQQQPIPHQHQLQQRPTQTPFAVRASSAILGSFMRGSSQSPPLQQPAAMSMSPPTESYMDPAAQGPPLPADSYVTSSPPAALPPPMSVSPPQPYVTASAPSPPQSASPDSFASQHHDHFSGAMAPAAGPAQPQQALDTAAYTNGQPPPSLHPDQAMPHPQPQPPLQLPQQEPPAAAAPISLLPVGHPPAPTPASAPAHQPLAQQPALPSGPPPEPFRTRNRVISLPRSYDLPYDPELQRHLHMGAGQQGQAADPLLPGGFMAAPQEDGSGGGAGTVMTADLATILENGGAEAQAPTGGAGGPSPSGQSPTEQRGSGLIGRIFTRGSTMQRLRELFMAWASPEADGTAAAHTDAAGALVTAPSTLLWGRSNSNPRSSGSLRTPTFPVPQAVQVPVSPDNGPNPFRQQLQRLGSMSSSWLLGKRSREEGSPNTQSSTPTSRKLQRGISGMFRPIVDMMSFGRRSGPLSSAAATAAAAAAAVAEVDAERAVEAAVAAAAAVTEVQPLLAADVVMQCAPEGANGHGVPVAAMAGGATASLPQLMPCNTDADGERLLLDTIDSQVLAALDVDAAVANPPQLPLAAAPAVPQPHGGHHLHETAAAALTAPPACDDQVNGAAMPYMQLQPLSAALQHPPPSASNAPVRGPVITTGATGPSGARPSAAAATAATTAAPPALPALQQRPFDGYCHTLQPQASVWALGEAHPAHQPMQVCQQHQQQHQQLMPEQRQHQGQHPHRPMQELLLGCDGGLQQHHHQHHHQQAVVAAAHPGGGPHPDDGNGGMMLRLSNSLDFLRQALWGGR